MVCAEDNETRCVINDSRPDAEQKRFSVTVRRHHTVAKLYEFTKLQSSHTDFDLSLVDPLTNDLVSLQDKQEEKLADVGIRFDIPNSLIIKPRVSDLQFLDPLEDMSSDDDLALGASASPVEPGNYNVPNPPALPSPPFDIPSTDRTSRNIHLRKVDLENETKISAEADISQRYTNLPPPTYVGHNMSGESIISTNGVHHTALPSPPFDTPSTDRTSRNIHLRKVNMENETKISAEPDISQRYTNLPPPTYVGGNLSGGSIINTNGFHHPALPSPPFDTPSTDRTSRNIHLRKVNMENETKISAEADISQRYTNLPPPTYIGGNLSGGSIINTNGGGDTHHNYRGLVNQAMTCYLNSLLQALYMTPEFRNALYNWEFDGENENKSIPYQLQRLFVNLQTSPKSAVETTDLTRSFGWDSAEGWQQHDIQELCRVMFDALEHKFRNTKQADLINRLYEGRMIDYVKCLECNTEKQREDKFLDIPLPVRPFGSTVANECVEEALQGFVKPEILNDTNQYFCDKCNKKCDAHKGLKFTKFPYILTLHLKRFDFDYQSFHRIKLNDKVTFPELLNLNHFVNASSDSSSDFKLTTSTIAAAAAAAEAAATSNGNGTGPMMMETAENFMKSDECSTTDSGSALEEDSFQNGGTSVSSTTTTPNDHFMVQDDDEGIDMELSSNGNSKSSPLNNSFIAPGPYKYELFAIMIHSGSASGGHYYAYIKDFKSSRWYSFNDQTVQPITQEDIHKSFGGGSYKTSYTGAYTSSTNAYMLMYRQIDGEKNAQPISEEQFPDHIKRLVAKIRDHEGNPSRDNLEMTRVKVAYENPHTRIVKTQRMALFNNSTLAETVQEALRMHHLKGVVPVERCRLVGYDAKNFNIERSFEDYEDKTIDEVMSQLKRSDGLLLEVREEGETFEKYLPHGVMTKVYKVDPQSRDVEGPLSIRANLTQTVAEYKAVIARKLKQSPKSLLVGMTVHKNSPKLLASEEATLADEHFIDYCKVFVMVVVPPPTQTIVDDVDQYSQRFLHFIQRLDHLVALYIVLPNLEQETLESLAIPRLSKETLASLVGADVSSAANTVTNSNATATAGDSNSEDSSLSDNDRTLVEDDFGHIKLNGGGLHLANGTSGAGLVNGDTARNGTNGGSVTPTTKTNGFKYSHDDDWDVDEDGEDEDAKILQNLQECKTQEYYFKVTHLGTGSSTESNNVSSTNGNGTSADDCTRSTSSGDNDKHIQVLIDKRSSQAYLKYRLQSVLQISMEYFKVFSAGNLYHQNNDTANLLNEFEYKDGERLAIELGRQLRKGEYKLNVSYVNVNEMTEEMDKLPFLCTMVVKNGQTFGQVKANILAQLASTHGENHKYNHLHMNNCRLRRKGIKYPAAVYKDDERIGKDVTLTQQVEVFLQEVEDLERVTPNDVNDAVLLLRRWLPSERKLGNFQEILHTEELELKERLSQISGIPVENVEYVRIQHSSLQCDNVLNIHGLNWISKPHYTVDDSVLFIHGTLLYYRDRTEPLKELTADERKELAKKDTTRTGSTYSPRKERALKIYLDASPKKVDD